MRTDLRSLKVGTTTVSSGEISVKAGFCESSWRGEFMCFIQNGFEMPTRGMNVRIQPNQRFFAIVGSIGTVSASGDGNERTACIIRIMQTAQLATQRG